DADRVMQVLMNLVSNAIKFTNEGKVTINTSRAKEGVKVSVKDTGPGIKKQDIGKLFQSFAQLRAEDKWKGGGTGLGLAISKKIIEQHGGKIWAKSKYGKGSAFSFILPFKAR
ncbi:MAG: ATP-binding protein, partial [Candidatus Omnitrophota bacterium]